ncbi:radial spoke head protein 3 [Tritrichomonas foetus]|uniref:Radial spoke head protein 3 n=1 Tax=Tritrichomonas foetus TaxID=1144522 RepID=A0A1J4JBV1_9EUKA|nr:radial spoke head protein 3 [Tritrichomonas foetus]|eukprot:OHS96624.1 radial spoke head protein 3 [Tritrichomonas foetus]
MTTQTDAFLDRPPTPPYIPPKNGIDIEIQVEEADLFDFDFEVQPIVATIVGKTLEQAFLEVNEEEELANIRRHKEAIEHQRNVELADVQRLEEAERRKFEEKQRRIEERLRVEAEQAELRAKVAARGFGEFFVSDLMGDAISLLERRGYFYDEVEREIDTVFMPWLDKAMEEASDTHNLIEHIEAKVQATALEIEEEQRNQFEIDTGVQCDRSQVRQQQLLRQMLVEDLAAQKIRKALEGVKKKDKPAHNEEEESED